MSNTINFRASQELRTRLDREAQSMGMTRSQVIVHILNKELFKDEPQSALSPELTDKLSEAIAITLFGLTELEPDEVSAVMEMKSDIALLFRSVS